MKKLLITIATSLLLVGCGTTTAETLKTTTTTAETTTTTTTQYLSPEDQYIAALQSGGIRLSSGDTDVGLGEGICEIFDGLGVNDTSIMGIFATFEDYGFGDEAADYIIAATMFLCPEYNSEVVAWANQSTTGLSS